MSRGLSVVAAGKTKAEEAGVDDGTTYEVSKDLSTLEEATAKALRDAAWQSMECVAPCLAALDKMRDETFVIVCTWGFMVNTSLEASFSNGCFQTCVHHGPPTAHTTTAASCMFMHIV